MEDTKENKSTGINKFLMAAAIVEAVAIIALLIMMGNNKREADMLISQIEKGTLEKDSLNREMTFIMDSYNQLQTTNDTINAQLEEQKARVSELMENLQKVKAQNRDSLKKYRAEVETLRAIMRSFVVQIDSLNTKNIELTEENTRLNDQLSDVQHRNRQLANVKDSLQGRVKEAEALKAVQMKMVALNERDNETSRIVKAHKFRVTFVINENGMTKTGNKDLYVRIVKPDGSILNNENSGLFKYQGKDISYSARKTITYDGNAQNTTIYAISREVLNAGVYQADVYCDGKDIGSVSVKLD